MAYRASIQVFIGSQVLCEPALDADEDGGVVVIPVGERISASPDFLIQWIAGAKL